MSIGTIVSTNVHTGIPCRHSNNPGNRKEVNAKRENKTAQSVSGTKPTVARLIIGDGVFTSLKSIMADNRQAIGQFVTLEMILVEAAHHGVDWMR